MASTTLEVQPDVTVDAPAPIEDFQAYESRRTAELSAASQPAEEEEVPEDIIEETPAAGEGEPEPSASETEKPAESEKTPEPESAPETDKTQEQEAEKEARRSAKRYDEAIKARHDAEREAAAVKERADKAEKEAQELKAKLESLEKAASAKPAETPDLGVKPAQPFAAAEPNPDDQTRYPLGNFDKQYIIDLNNWLNDKREHERAEDARVKKETSEAEVRVRAEAEAKEATAADQKVTQERFDNSVKSAQERHEDYGDRLKTPLAKEYYSAAMAEAIRDCEDPAEVIYQLLGNADEFNRIREVTKLPDKFTPSQFRAAMKKATLEISKFEQSLVSATPAPAATAASPAPEKPAEATPPPENPKPAVSRAAKPAASVRPSTTPPATKSGDARDFEQYEKLRRAETSRR